MRHPLAAASLLPAAVVLFLLAACDDGPSHEGSGPVARPGDPTAPPSATATPDDSAERWVRGVCLAFDDWRADLEGLAGGVALGPVPADVDAARAEALRFLDSVVLETDDLIVRLDGLDPPGVADGRAIAEAVSASAREARGSFELARGELRAVAPGDATAYAAAIATARDAFAGAGPTLTAALADIDRRFDTTELSRILVATPECSAL